MFGRPIEIFTGHADGFWMPPWVISGWTIRTFPDEVHERYDFLFEDRQGYVVTIEGLSRSFNKSAYKCSKIITKLLMNDTKIDLILDTINDFPFSEILNEQDYCQGIKDALTSPNLVTKVKPIKGGN